MTKDEIKKHNLLCEQTKQKIGPGPWAEEVNRYNWKAFGLDCMIVRNPCMLHWCGYVGVKKNHPLYGKDYDDCGDLQVHGGLSYADKCGGHVCHTDDDNKDPVWWLGFDCAHFGDQVPAMRVALKKDDGSERYWTQEMVMKETMGLAKQVAAAGGKKK